MSTISCIRVSREISAGARLIFVYSGMSRVSHNSSNLFHVQFPPTVQYSFSSLTFQQIFGWLSSIFHRSFPFYPIFSPLSRLTVWPCFAPQRNDRRNEAQQKRQKGGFRKNRANRFSVDTNAHGSFPETNEMANPAGA